MAFSPDGRLLAVAAEAQVVIWEVAGGKRLAALDAQVRLWERA